ncbi:MAG: L,D-transpeptidase family protein [Bacteroidota bacterium]
MIRITIKIILVIFLFSFKTDSFKDDQKKYARVRQAYKEKEANILALLKKNSISTQKLRIYLRAFKQENKIELWAKNSNDKTFKLLKKYDICSTSGVIGPKREQGDLQIPEGFYHINRFNPYSNFYLSLGLNYPNRSDKILGTKGNLGGDIFIHGDCVTIGCMPITDDKIKELYVFCVEAKNSGQTKIPVTVFPTELSNSKFASLKLKYKSSPDKIGLWTDLKKGYDIFNETKCLPSIGFLNTGRHSVTE